MTDEEPTTIIPSSLDQKKSLDGILSNLEEATGPVFNAPWQARAFGLVIALHDHGNGFDWQDFQQQLIDEVQITTVETDTESDDSNNNICKNADDDVEQVYYEQWLAAFERLLIEDEVLEPMEVEMRATEFAEGERTAEEFIEGERDH